MDAHARARARAADGWRALRAFVTDGVRHLPDAVAAFEEAERLLRRSGAGAERPGRESGGADRAVDPARGGSEGAHHRLVQIEDVEATLIGLSMALRLRRRPDGARRAVVLTQELLNIVRRRSGDAAAVPLRAYLEDAYRDLADVTEGADAVRAAEEGIEACDRTLALARRLHVDDAVAHARATKALLLRRLAAVQPGADAQALSREADRLTAAALTGWPARDAEGLAAFQVDAATALVEGAHPRSSAVDRAEALLRQAERAVPAENRYLAVRLARARARVALTADRPDALDAVAAAAAAFRDLGLEREAEEVEHWL